MIALAACSPSMPPAQPQLGPDGLPLPTVYRISAFDQNRIEIRMLDAVNALRAEAGVPQVQYNAALNAAAATHARDMSVQNRPWLFGSDGSSPIDRIQRVGYSGQYVGEAISESYETELETLRAWMDREDTRGILLSPDARDMGFAWFQESNGKIWWDLVLGTGSGISSGGDQVASAF